MAVSKEKTQKQKHCTVHSTRHTLSGCSMYTEHATPHIVLAQLDASVFGLASSVLMRSNSDNLFKHLEYIDQTPICSTLESFNIRGSTVLGKEAEIITQTTNVRVKFLHSFLLIKLFVCI